MLQNQKAKFVIIALHTGIHLREFTNLLLTRRNPLGSSSWPLTLRTISLGSRNYRTDISPAVFCPPFLLQGNQEARAGHGQFYLQPLQVSEQNSRRVSVVLGLECSAALPQSPSTTQTACRSPLEACEQRTQKQCWLALALLDGCFHLLAAQLVLRLAVHCPYRLQLSQ